MQGKNKQYKNHKLGLNLSEYDYNPESDTNTVDQNYLQGQIQIHVDYLKSKGIKECPNLTKILHEHKFRSSDEQNLLKSYVDFKYIKDPLNPIFLLKKREMKKANSSHRNILLNRLSCEYSYDFLCFLKEFLEKNKIGKHNEYIDKEDKEAIISNFSEQINCLLSSQNSTDDADLMINTDFSVVTEFNTNNDLTVYDSGSMAQPVDSDEEHFTLQFEDNEDYYFCTNY